MGLTMTEKILAAHGGLTAVRPGDFVRAETDLILSSDATFPVTVKAFYEAGFTRVHRPERVVLVMDHFTPNKDIKAAENVRACREFAQTMGIENFYDVGRMGIEHALLPEQGFVAPGELVIGGDSHTCTYGALGAFSTGVGSTDVAAGLVDGRCWLRVPATLRINLSGELADWVGGKDVILTLLRDLGVSGALYQAMEYGGPGLAGLSLDARLTMANMAIEVGAKNGIFEVDDRCLAYVNQRVSRPFTVVGPDPDAVYQRTLEINLSDIRPMVAYPHLPSNGRPVDQAERIALQEVLIGSCTNGRLSDLAMAAQILKGQKVAKGLRVLIIPGTQQIYLEAVRRGYVETFIEAGCAVSTPTCGACGGGHMGLMGKGERVLSTSNRNFIGRMGHIDSEIYLCGPAVAAASAVAGYITGPDGADQMRGRENL